MSTKTLLSITLLLLAVVAPIPAAAAPLFTALPEKAVTPDGPEVLRSRAVHLDLAGLLDSMDARRGPGTLELNLFADAWFTAQLDRIAFESASTVSWIGHVPGIADSQVILVAGGGVVVGSVTWPGTAFQLRYSPAGVHVIQQVDPEAYPAEHLPVEVPPPSRLAYRAPHSLALRDDGSTFDVLVVYNRAARQAAGGTTAIKNLIALGVTETNQAYANSGIIPRLRLVYSGEISYNETGSISTTLTRLQNPSDGHMDSVHSLRNTYGADLVKFVGNSTSGGCGVAYLMAGSNNPGFEAWAFSVTSRSCISPNYTFGHELGHNMGCNHAPDDPVGTGAFSYSFGYKNPSAVFRTVMAYNCSPSCPRVLHFSNPSITYSGYVTGTSTQNNATSINNVRTVVANFRQATQ